jgi:predicted ATPase
LIERGQLRESNGQWAGWEIDELHVPATIREAVLARLSELSADARRLADVSAVFGTHATHDELAAVSGLDSDALMGAIDELRASDVLTERVDESEIVYDFSHPLIQETLYSELGLARTRTLHGTIAETLEQLYGTRAMSRADELAFHYARGDSRRLASKAVAIPSRGGSQRVGQVCEPRGGGLFDPRAHDRRGGRRVVGRRARGRSRSRAATAR